MLGDAPSSELFREAQQAVVVSMKLDIFPRFIESKLYEDLVGLKFEDRKVANMGAFDLYRFLGAGGFGMVRVRARVRVKVRVRVPRGHSAPNPNPLSLT